MPRLRKPAVVIERFLRGAAMAAGIPEATAEYVQEYRLWEVVVPAKEEVCRLLAEAPHYFGAADPLDPSLPVCFDVVAFFPIPVPEWQEAANEAFDAYANGWRAELRRIQSALRDAVMYTLPFGQLLVGSVDNWVTKNRVEHVVISDYVDEWAGREEGTIGYVRRPYVVWPRSVGTGRHVMMVAVGGEIRELSIERQSLSYPTLVPCGFRKF